MTNVLVRDLSEETHRELLRRAEERGQSLQQYLAAETRSTSTSLGDGAVHRLLLLDVAGVDGDGTDPDQPAGGLPPAGARRSRSGTVLVALRPRVYQPSATRVRAEVQ